MSTQKHLKPSTELRDADGLLHSDKGAALVFTGIPEASSPPTKFYYIHGIYFSLYRWYDIVEKTISLKIVLSLPIPERQAIAKYVGIEKLFYNSRPKLTSKSARGNELFRIRIPGVRRNRDPYSYWLRYKCPSTGKVYISGIDPSFVSFALDSKALFEAITFHMRYCPWLADCAMAWKLGLTLTEYYSITEEA